MEPMLNLIRGLALALAVFAAAASAQSDSTHTAPVPADASNAQRDDSETRHNRVWAVSAEVGINSLSSLIGPVFTVYARPQLALDLGAGLSTSGLRPGIRARYLFTPRDQASFFGGVGYKIGLGSGSTDVKVKDPDTKEDLMVHTDPASFLDAMLGTEFLANNGFLVIANAGFSVLLGGKPYSVTQGAPSKKALKTFDTIFGSGIMLSVSLGKAF
jgi:hypothetical protein